MEDTLITLLETFNYPVIRQGSMPEAETYPDTFITFWCESDREVQAYSNQTFTAKSTFYLAAYSNAPATAYELSGQILALLKANGWQMIDRGHDVASDQDTHIGRGLTVAYTETLTLNEGV